MFLNDIVIRRFIKIIMILTALWFSFVLRDILLLLFIVIILSSALKPFVHKLERFKIPRAASVLGLILFVVGFAVLVIQVIIQDVSSQWSDLSLKLGENINIVINRFGLESYFSNGFGNTITQQFQNLSTNQITNVSQFLLLGTASIFGGFLTVITTVTLLFYLVMDPNKMSRFITDLLPSKWESQTVDIIRRGEEKLSSWLVGQLTLMAIMGTVSYIGFSAIGIEFALPLAVLTGLADIVPMVGAIVSFAVVFAITLATDPLKAVLVAVFFFVIQQVEANFLIPRVMSKSVGLDPVVVIISLMIGSSLAGIIGAVLSIPACAIVMIGWEEWQKAKQTREREEEEKELPGEV